MAGAFRGLRNPLESWAKSDSIQEPEGFIIGENDMALACKLIHAGTTHRKFMRQILVCVDITAPLYFWKEFDTYKVGTTANSTSTMHKVMANPISIDMFEIDDFMPFSGILDTWSATIKILNLLRDKYLLYISRQDSYNAKMVWKELIRILPEAWLQTRTITFDYEVLLSQYDHRHNHKLTEWHSYCDWINTLPYMQFFIEAAKPNKEKKKGSLPKDLHITKSDTDTGLTDDRSISLEGGSGMNHVEIFMHGSNVSANAQAILEVANGKSN